jgi:hypothetical protein
MPVETTSLLQRTLDLARLAPFWHADLPGRRPLRIVRNDIVGDATGLKMFGVPVELVERAAAVRDTLPTFEFTSLQPGVDAVTIGFRYPVEGVVGQVVFRKRGAEWIEERVELAEQ